VADNFADKERPELMEEASGAAEDATAERGILCADAETRWLSVFSFWDFPNISLSCSFIGIEIGCQTA